MTTNRTTHTNRTTDQLIEDLSTRRFQARGWLPKASRRRNETTQRLMTNELRRRGLSDIAINNIR